MISIHIVELYYNGYTISLQRLLNILKRLNQAFTRISFYKINYDAQL